MVRVVTSGVGIAPKVFVGRLAPAPGGTSREAVGVGRVVGASYGPDAFQIPATVDRKADGSATAKTTASIGQVRVGRHTLVKPGLHWALVRNADGDYELQSVQGWLEFGPPQKVQTTPATTPAPTPVPAPASGSAPAPKAQAKAKAGDKRNASALAKLALKPDGDVGGGEAELLANAGERKQFSERWESIKNRRDLREGQAEPGESEPSNSKSKREEYPDEVRLNDETGARHQKKKAAKMYKKQAAALDDLEDMEDVPDTANALLDLKNQKGEGCWDFSDDELYSDDELDKFDWDADEGLKKPEEEEEAAPSADEDEGEDEEKGKELTTHGKELQVLIENYGEGEEPPASADGGDAVDGGDVALLQAADAEAALPAASESDGEASEGEGDAKRRRKNETDGTKAAVSAPAASLAVADTSAAAVPEPTDTQLRTQAIACLRQKGGQCTLADAAAALGLRDRHSKLYQRVVAVLKQVASVERLAGQARPVLVLKKEHQG